jgi:hypothetical protein
MDRMGFIRHPFQAGQHRKQDKMILRQPGGRLVAAMAVLLAIAGNAAAAQDHKTYRCKVADVVNLGDDGRLRLDSNPRTAMRQQYDGVVIDTLTGAVTFSNGSRQLWNVVQRGTSANDYVLVLPTALYPPQERIAARAATDFIRLRAWKEEPTVKFLAFGLSSFASGPCEVVR